VIVHVMRAEVRARYDLEGFWGDAPQVSLKAPPPKARRKRRKLLRKKTS
jgi:hypothetical protein